MTAVPINLMDMKDICIKLSTNTLAIKFFLIIYGLILYYFSLEIVNDDESHIFLLIQKWVNGIMIMNFMIISLVGSKKKIFLRLGSFSIKYSL